MKKITQKEREKIIKFVRENQNECLEIVEEILIQLKFAEENSKEEKNFTENQLERIITDKLNYIGMPRNLSGFKYVRTAIKLAIINPNCIMLVTKELYPEVAKIHETTPSRVERAIRHAIERVWQMGNLDAINELFGYTVNKEKGKPTNSEFIDLLADEIKLKFDN